MIEEYIPTGHKNRISREDLEKFTGKLDRVNRRLIREALDRNVLIINTRDGYFIPDMTQDEDRFLVTCYYNRERAKAKSLLARCSKVMKAVNVNGQMEMLEDDWMD